MASLVYNAFKAKSASGLIDLDTDTIKVMLVAAGYVPDADDEFVDEGGADDPIDHEISVTGYTGGFGGSGRKTIALTVTKDNANDRAVVDGPDQTWTALGAGATIAGAVFIKEGTDDTDTELIFYVDLAPDTATNGNDFTAAWDAVGIATFT